MLTLKIVYCAVSCSIKSMTTGWGFSTGPLGANPFVPSGPLGCLMTTILAPPLAISSMFMVFSLEIRRSGLWEVLQQKIVKEMPAKGNVTLTRAS